MLYSCYIGDLRIYYFTILYGLILIKINLFSINVHNIILLFIDQFYYWLIQMLISNNGFLRLPNCWRNSFNKINMSYFVVNCNSANNGHLKLLKLPINTTVYQTPYKIVFRFRWFIISSCCCFKWVIFDFIIRFSTCNCVRINYRENAFQ